MGKAGVLLRTKRVNTRSVQMPLETHRTTYIVYLGRQGPVPFGRRSLRPPPNTRLAVFKTASVFESLPSFSTQHGLLHCLGTCNIPYRT